jgi:hypothetical protein
MRSISLWARDHAWSSRLLIVLVIYPLLNLTGLFLGDLLESSKIVFSSSWTYILSFVIILLFLFYPGRNERGYKNFRFRKIMDSLLVVSTFLCILLSGNQLAAGNQVGFIPASHAALIQPAPTSAVDKPEKKKSLKKKIQSLRKKYRDLDTGAKIALTLLAAVVFVGLVYLLGALSCSIACSGAEGGAYVVFFLGLGGLIFGLVKVLKLIHKGPKKKRTTDPATNQS